MKQTTAIVLTVFLAATFLAGCDRLMSVEQRLERAQAAYDAGRDAAAMSDVKAVLERDSANVAGRLLLARLSLRLGDPATARKELDRAVQAGAAPAAVGELDQAILLAQGRYGDALAAATRATDDRSARRQVVIVDALMGLGRTDEARKTLDAALLAAPDDRDLLLADARWSWASGRSREAGEALDRLLAKYPDFARAAYFRGRIAMSAGDPRRALQSFEAARAHMGAQLGLPEQYGVIVGVVESHLALNDLDAADKALGELSRRAPGAFGTHYLKARVAFARRDYDAATTALREALAVDPGSVPGRLLLGAALTEKGSLEQAGADLSSLLADHPENIEVRKQLARVLLARGDAAGARRVLAEAPAASADAGTDWMSGSILMMSGETGEAIAKLEQGVAAAPDNAAIRLDLASAYLTAGRREDALAVLQALSPEAGGLRRSQLLVLAGASGKDRAGARQAIVDLLKANPQDAGLAVVGGYYLLSTGDLATADRVFGDVLRSSPRNVGAQLGQGATALQAARFDDAAKGFERALALEPTDERAYIGLAAVALAKADSPAAVQWLEKAISAKPSAVESRLQLADILFRQGETAKAKALIDQALAATHSRAATLDRAGQVLLRASQFDAALQRFTEAMELGDDRAGVSAARAMLALGRVDDARARLEAAARTRPDWVAPAALLVRLDIGQKQYDRALERLDALEKAGGPAPAVDELRGDALFAANRLAQAAQAYGRAARVRPGPALAIKIYRTARASAAPHPEAGLVEWLNDHPSDALVRVALAEHYQFAGNRSQAIAQYEQALKVSKAPALLNNLAWLYQEVDDPRALDLAREAYKAAPENHGIADTYGWILLKSGNIADSLPVLEGAARGEPGSAEVQYHYAAALAKAGQKEAAATVLRKLMDQNERFPSRSAAQALLDSLER